MDSRYDVLTDAARPAREFVDGLAERPVGASAGVGELRERLARPLTAAGEDPRTVIAQPPTSIPVSSRRPGRATSASSSAGRCPRRSRPTG